VYAYHGQGDWIMHNLKDDPAHAKRRKDLRDRLEAIRKDIGENLPVKGKAPRR